ncbi:MAG: endonuclease Q family protein [Patescibacteria group bacterium]|nr:endonuclease Q family protein [Patescibacteria group bacterium]
MRIIADLHLHSKYSRGCSKNLDVENLNYWGKWKGLNLIATGDYTHPLWFQELKSKLIEYDEGIFKLKSGNDESYFILSCELSSIYNKKGKIRRIHYLIFFPDFDSVERFNQRISGLSNLRSDGRPILGLDVNDVLKISLEINEKVIFIPAHIWTPWFSLYGSMSGFDSLFEAFEENIKYLGGVETGLSSDPQMNWRISELDNLPIVSFSDAHSPYPHRIGREATVFELEKFNFNSLYKALKNPNEKNKIVMTIEFFPEEGKYHYDGHRLCQIKCSPEESKKMNYICPICQKKLTIGVLSRVEELADRPSDYFDSKRPPFKRTIPLTEILGEIYQTQPTTKKVLDVYFKILEDFKSEIDILIGNYDQKKMEEKYPTVFLALKRIEDNKIILYPGYDGEYGKIKIFEEEKVKNANKTLF